MKSKIPAPIVLASTSPRRIDLMNQIGLRVTIIPPQLDETAKKGEKPKQLVKRLAYEKALSIKTEALKKQGSCLILAADTIVVSPSGQEILGKPKHKNDARRMLQILSGKTHQVLTGYCWLKVHPKKPDQKVTQLVQSKVKMRPISPKAITQYVSTGEPMDKAGSYAAQGLGMSLIESIEGSYANVIGLPISQVLQNLEKEFKIPFLSWLSSDF